MSHLVGDGVKLGEIGLQIFVVTWTSEPPTLFLYFFRLQVAENVLYTDFLRLYT